MEDGDTLLSQCQEKEANRGLQGSLVGYLSGRRPGQPWPREQQKSPNPSGFTAALKDPERLAGGQGGKFMLGVEWCGGWGLLVFLNSA